MSALPPKADIRLRIEEVRFVPLRDIPTASSSVALTWPHSRSDPADLPIIGESLGSGGELAAEVTGD